MSIARLLQTALLNRAREEQRDHHERRSSANDPSVSGLQPITSTTLGWRRPSTPYLSCLLLA